MSDVPRRAAAAAAAPRTDARTGAAPPPGTRALDSAALFAGATELLIDHRGVRYRLRQTALGKLILTK